MKAAIGLFLFAVLFSATPQTAQAVEVNISAGSRHHHHHRSGGVGFSLRTGDPTYTTWYPNSTTTTTTYNYSSPSYTTTTTYNTPSYTYRTEGPSFGVWFGSDRYRSYRRDHHHHHHHDHDRHRHRR